MKEIYNSLIELQSDVNDLEFSDDSAKLLNSFLKYRDFLSEVAKSDSIYASSLQGIQSELRDIRADIDIAKAVNNEKQIRHFRMALNHLKDDLREFIDIVRSHEGYEKTINTNIGRQ